MPDPIGETITSSRRPNGLEVRQGRVPLGVIFMIYESRPNVTVDAAALCIKSGNAVILRGGKEAIYTNRALHRILADELATCGLPEYGVQLVPTTDRAAVGELLALPEYIDLAIRGAARASSAGVVAEAKMPVLKALRGQLPRLCGRSLRLDMARPDHPQRQGPASRRLQRGGDLARPSRRRPLLPPEGGRGPHRRGGSSSAETPSRA